MPATHGADEGTVTMRPPNRTRPIEEERIVTESESEHIKEQFREALERKSHQHSKHGNAPAGDSKIHQSHGPSDHKREFRRKSG